MITMVRSGANNLDLRNKLKKSDGSSFLGAGALLLEELPEDLELVDLEDVDLEDVDLDEEPEVVLRCGLLPELFERDLCVDDVFAIDKIYP